MQTAVLNVVGLTSSLIGEHAPNLLRHARQGQVLRIRPDLPAVTCSVQASMLTGRRVREHGIVANGWYHRDLSEIRFWNRSNRLIQAEQVWKTARRRDPGVTCANLFWWHNTYANAEAVLNVRPIYKADGRKLPDCYSQPADLRDRLQAKLGTFPLFHFWGPAADIRSSRWIAEAAVEVHREYRPTLTLVYLPHLDYALQKLGPDHPEMPRHVAEIDAVVGRLLDYFVSVGVRPLIVSEYGVEPVSAAVPINRALRDAGLLAVREEQGLELLEAGASRAFAVADHQVALVYVPDEADLPRVAAVCSEVEGVDQVLGRAEQRELGIDHERNGDLLLLAGHGRWFSYDYWLDEARAPDFARTVDIHRKPGYDPRELFLDPAIRMPRLKIAGILARKAAGMRYLMNVIPLDASLVRGSHGRTDLPEPLQPVLILPEGSEPADAEVLPCQAVRDVVLSSLFEDRLRVPR